MTQNANDEFSESAYSLALKEFYDTSAELFTSLIPIIDKVDTDNAKTFLKQEAFEYVSVQLFHQYKMYTGDLTNPQEIAADILQQSRPPYQATVHSELAEDKNFILAFGNFCLKAEKLSTFPAQNDLRMESFQ